MCTTMFCTSPLPSGTKVRNDPVPFIKYILGTILSAYRDFEDRVQLVDEKLPAVDLVRRAVQKKVGKFTKSEIMELCPPSRRPRLRTP